MLLSHLALSCAPFKNLLFIIIIFNKVIKEKKKELSHEDITSFYGAVKFLRHNRNFISFDLA